MDARLPIREGTARAAGRAGAVAGAFLTGTFAVLANLLLPAAAHATPIPLQTLVVSTFTLHVDSPALGSGDFPVPAGALPADLRLGVYQDPILHLGGGPTDVRVFSAPGPDGLPAPSATADAATGTLAVDFRSLQVATRIDSPAGPFLFGGPFVPLTLPPATDLYDPATGAFSLTWDATVPAVVGIPVPGDLRVRMAGTAVPASIPEPAVPALLLAGVLGAYAGRRRRGIASPPGC